MFKATLKQFFEDLPFYVQNAYDSSSKTITFSYKWEQWISIIEIGATKLPVQIAQNHAR